MLYHNATIAPVVNAGNQTAAGHLACSSSGLQTGVEYWSLWAKSLLCLASILFWGKLLRSIGGVLQ